LLEKSGTGDGSALIRIEMNELDAEAYAKRWRLLTFDGHVPKDAGQFKFEAILIDGAMLRPDPATWYELSSLS